MPPLVHAARPPLRVSRASILPAATRTDPAMPDSCFVKRLSHYLPLSAGERSALARLEIAPELLRAGEVLFEEGEPTDFLALVSHGWLTSSALLAEGQRQILRVHLNGDMVGLSGIAFDHSVCTVVASTDSEICRFPRRALAVLFGEHPRLAALFFSLGMVETVDMYDRLKAVGRTNGKARLAQFFLSVLSRDRVTSAQGGLTIVLPLTQSDVADAVGLTNIHVNRLLRELVEDGLIRRDRSAITVRDEPAMQTLAQFTNRFERIDTSWFPPSAA